MIKVRKPLVLILFIAICLGAGGLGSIFTTSAIPVWYATLVKPVFSPPNWVFAPVWTTLCILMGISAYLIYQAKNKNSQVALKIFWIHLAVNLAWSYLFFGLKNPFYGLVWITFLWSLIVAVMYQFLKIEKKATLILVPYLLWVTFAAILNYNIWFLNSP